MKEQERPVGKHPTGRSVFCWRFTAPKNFFQADFVSFFRKSFSTFFAPVRGEGINCIYAIR